MSLWYETSQASNQREKRRDETRKKRNERKGTREIGAKKRSERRGNESKIPVEAGGLMRSEKDFQLGVGRDDRYLLGCDSWRKEVVSGSHAPCKRAEG